MYCIGMKNVTQLIWHLHLRQKPQTQSSLSPTNWRNEPLGLEANFLFVQSLDMLEQQFIQNHSQKTLTYQD